MSNEIIALTGGIDVGNGYVKGLIRGRTLDQIDMPSAVASTARPTLKVPDQDGDAPAVLAGEDFYNKIAASFTSPLVNHSDLRIFGHKALSANGSKFTQFDVIGNRSKSDQELASVLVLGVFAAKALRDYVNEHGALPTQELQVQVRAGLALPIAEYVTHRGAFAGQFYGPGGQGNPSAHIVTVKNFDTPVTVRLTFIDVQVLPEGASAHFAIADKGAPLAQALLDDLRASDATFAANLAGVTADALVSVKNTIGVDLGEGTCNLPVFTDGNFNAEASTTIQQGYGTALTNALARMEAADQDLRFGNRKQLADFLMKEPTPFTADRHARASIFVAEEAGYLCEEIRSRFEDVLTEIGGTTEVVYVYGGGSGPVKEILRPLLQKAAGSIPVLYLDASFSRKLNREGLYLAARLAEKRAALVAG